MQFFFVKCIEQAQNFNCKEKKTIEGEILFFEQNNNSNIRFYLILQEVKNVLGFEFVMLVNHDKT